MTAVEIKPTIYHDNNLTDNVKVKVKGVNVYYGDKQALFDVSMNIPDRGVTAFIGPSGCGKSTFLRCMNRMNDTIESCKVSGSFDFEGRDIYHPKQHC